VAKLLCFLQAHTAGEMTRIATYLSQTKITIKNHNVKAGGLLFSQQSSTWTTIEWKMHEKWKPQQKLMVETAISKNWINSYKSAL